MVSWRKRIFLLFPLLVAYGIPSKFRSVIGFLTSKHVHTDIIT